MGYLFSIGAMVLYGLVILVGVLMGKKRGTFFQALAWVGYGILLVCIFGQSRGDNVNFVLYLVAWVVLVVAFFILLGRKKEKAQEPEVVQEPVVEEPVKVAPVKKEYAIKFTLSREDVLDYLEDMANNLEKYPVQANVRLRTKNHLSDSLNCGVWTFAMMYEKNDTIKFVLRISDERGLELGKKYTSVRAGFPKGDYWYNMIIDQKFNSKKEVFGILDECYFFVLGKYYTLTDNGYVTDEELAKQEEQEVSNQLAENENADDELFDAAVAEREKAVKEYRSSVKIKFEMSREKIMKHEKELKLAGVEVQENSKWHLPACLKIEDKTYAMVYEKDGEVSLTLRVSDEIGKEMAETRPEVRRARFPKTRNWYIVPVDGTFTEDKELYDLIDTAREFVKNN